MKRGVLVKRTKARPATFELASLEGDAQIHGCGAMARVVSEDTPYHYHFS